MGVVDVDERGRVVIPREMREALGIRPGGQVRFERTSAGIILRPELPMREALARLKEEVARLPKGRRVRVDPLRVKDIWDPEHKLREIRRQR